MRGADGAFKPHYFKHKLDFIGRVLYYFQRHKILLDSANTNIPAKNRNCARLVIRTTFATASKRLLTDDRTSTFRVQVQITGSMFQNLLRPT